MGEKVKRTVVTSPPKNTRSSYHSVATLPNMSKLHCITQAWASLAPDSSQAKVSQAAKHTLKCLVIETAHRSSIVVRIGFKHVLFSDKWQVTWLSTMRYSASDDFVREFVDYAYRKSCIHVFVRGIAPWVFFKMTQYNANAHNTQAQSPLWIHVRKPYPYEHLRRTEHRQIWRFPKSPSRCLVFFLLLSFTSLTVN
jgi:hypothetical protein